MPRKAEIQAEETAAASPLRRSTRKPSLNSLAPTTLSAKRVLLSEAPEAKGPKTRRASTSRENSNVDEKVENKPATRGRRASATKEETDPIPEPAKTRTRRSSAAAELTIEEEPKTHPITRRRRSSATENPPEPETAKPIRTRRSSATEKSNEEEPAKRTTRARRGSVTEDEPKEEPVRRSTRSRSSVDRDDVEPKEKKPTTRGRRSSTDGVKDEPEAKAVKLTPVKPKRRLSVTENTANLEPIQESESEVKGRNSTSPTLKDTPADDSPKTTDAKKNLNLSIINESSFTEAQESEDKQNKEKATPRRSPRLSKATPEKSSNSTDTSVMDENKSAEKPKPTPKKLEFEVDDSKKEMKEREFPNDKSENSFKLCPSIDTGKAGEKEDDLNSSKSSNASDKENVDTNMSSPSKEKPVQEKKQLIETVTSENFSPRVEVEVARISNVFRPRMKENSFLEPMDVDEYPSILVPKEEEVEETTISEKDIAAETDNDSVDDSFCLSLTTDTEDQNESLKDAPQNAAVKEEEDVESAKLAEKDDESEVVKNSSLEEPRKENQDKVNEDNNSSHVVEVEEEAVSKETHSNDSHGSLLVTEPGVKDVEKEIVLNETQTGKKSQETETINVSQNSDTDIVEIKEEVASIETQTDEIKLEADDIEDSVFVEGAENPPPESKTLKNTSPSHLDKNNDSDVREMASQSVSLPKMEQESNDKEKRRSKSPSFVYLETEDNLKCKETLSTKSKSPQPQHKGIVKEDVKLRKPKSPQLSKNEPIKLKMPQVIIKKLEESNYVEDIDWKEPNISIPTKLGQISPKVRITVEEHSKNVASSKKPHEKSLYKEGETPRKSKSPLASPENTGTKSVDQLELKEKTKKTSKDHVKEVEERKSKSPSSRKSNSPKPKQETEQQQISPNVPRDVEEHSRNITSSLEPYKRSLRIEVETPRQSKSPLASPENTETKPVVQLEMYMKTKKRSFKDHSVTGVKEVEERKLKQGHEETSRKSISPEKTRKRSVDQLKPKEQIKRRRSDGPSAKVEEKMEKKSPGHSKSFQLINEFDSSDSPSTQNLRISDIEVEVRRRSRSPEEARKLRSPQVNTKPLKDTKEGKEHLRKLLKAKTSELPKVVSELIMGSKEFQVSKPSKYSDLLQTPSEGEEDEEEEGEKSHAPEYDQSTVMASFLTTSQFISDASTSTEMETVIINRKQTLADSDMQEKENKQDDGASASSGKEDGGTAANKSPKAKEKPSLRLESRLIGTTNRQFSEREESDSNDEEEIPESELQETLIDDSNDEDKNELDYCFIDEVQDYEIPNDRLEELDMYSDEEVMMSVKEPEGKNADANEECGELEEGSKEVHSIPTDTCSARKQNQNRNKSTKTRKSKKRDVLNNIGTEENNTEERDSRMEDEEVKSPEKKSQSKKLRKRKLYDEQEALIKMKKQKIAESAMKDKDEEEAEEHADRYIEETVSSLRDANDSDLKVLHSQTEKKSRISNEYTEDQNEGASKKSKKKKKSLSHQAEESISKSTSKLEPKDSKDKNTPKKSPSSKLDEFLSRKIADMEHDEQSCSEDDENPEEPNEFVCTMAEEGEEDTPSEDSNAIIDEGESINSTDTERGSTDDDYDENDSFICDEEYQQLLSGEEYDLDDEEKEKKKKKSRIISLDSFDEDQIIKMPKKKSTPMPKKKKSRIITVMDSSGSEDDLSELRVSDNEEVQKSSEEITESGELTCIEAKSSDVSIVKSKPVTDSAENSLNGSSITPQRKRVASITIHENIDVKEIKDAKLTKRISCLVDSFCTTMHKGEISMNLSIECSAKDDEASEDESKKNEAKKLKSSSSSSDVVLMEMEESEAEGPSRKLSVSMDHTHLPKSKKKKKRKKSKSMDDLVEIKTKSEKKKKNKKKKAAEKSPQTNYPADSVGFGHTNQLVTDVRNRPRRAIKPSSNVDNSWIIEQANMKPSISAFDKQEKAAYKAGAVHSNDFRARILNDPSRAQANVKPSVSAFDKQEKAAYKAGKVHPKDFRTQMLNDPSRIRRIDTKTLLRKKGVYL